VVVGLGLPDQRKDIVYKEEGKNISHISELIHIYIMHYTCTRLPIKKYLKILKSKKFVNVFFDNCKFINYKKDDL